ncbi:MAG TPA: phytanoyl-CoA dioxygenase family protein [Vicinamibacterales bacterium]|nr:phytanoyl-CoA dioxygenase family protein [Vicinamibacterales bacterium]
MNATEEGFSINEQVFHRSEMIAALTELEHAPIARTKAGARHVLNVPVVQRLATDPRLIRLAGRVVGPAPVPFRAMLFDKSAESNWLVVWHQDTALPLRERVAGSEWGPWSEKSGVLYAHAPAWALDTVIALRVHLDDSTAENGPLRVLPATHKGGVLSDEVMRQLARDIAPVECQAASGGVVAMRPLTVHASSKASGGSPRRVLHIEYAASVYLGAGIELAIG